MKFVLNLCSLMLMILFSAVPPVRADNPTLDWNTFIGGSDTDRGQAVAVDNSGNIYVVGYSYAGWGTPVNAYTGGCEGFLAKFDRDGNRLWNTLMGCGSVDWAVTVAVDGSGNIYVAGTSFAVWGTPINPFGGGFADGFLAKFNSDGNRLWNTFLGGTSGDYAYAVTLDAAGSPYLTGLSGAAWGSPINPYTSQNDAYLAKFNDNGARLWHTFLGGSGQQQGQDLAVSPGGDIVVTGKTNSSWAAQGVQEYSGGEDCFVTAFNSSGIMLWNTYLGGTGNDQGYGIVVDSGGDYLVVGSSTVSWGTPQNAHAGNGDAFAAKLDAGSGNLDWNTFVGGSGQDYGYAIDLDDNDNVFITGYCGVSWGTPLNPHSGVDDLFIAALTAGGVYHEHTFYGSNGYEDARGIVYDTARQSLLLTGYGSSTWGTPVTPYTGGSYDAFLFRFVPGEAAAPTIGLSRTAINFGAEQNGAVTPAATSRVSNSGTGTLNWTATPSAGWLSVTPGSGTNAGILTIGIADAGLAPGAYQGTVTVSDPNATNNPQTISVNYQVYEFGTNSLPFGRFDTPIDQTTVLSSIPVTGWALDNIGFQSVKIYRGTDFSDRAFIGEAVFVEGARPDVEAAYPGHPEKFKAGWGYMMLTNFLPLGDGPYNLLAYAVDLEGNEVLLGQKSIIVANATAVLPFGAIDTPTQGGTASGNLFYNFGWALTPQPNSIPVNGSTLNVWVDGLPLGHPSYNHYRSDIASLFPGYANTNGAIGVYNLDTTAYEDGVHSIAWSVQDSAGNVDGIGSRNFNIQNTGGPVEPLSGTGPEAVRSFEEIERMPGDFWTPVFVKRGMGEREGAELAVPGPDGSIRIEIPEVNRVAVFLNESASAETTEDMARRRERLLDKTLSEPIRYEAYALVLGELRKLPAGATFDGRDGLLYWQPGPGFLGEHQFVVVDRIANAKKIIKILINKFFSQTMREAMTSRLKIKSP